MDFTVYMYIFFFWGGGGGGGVFQIQSTVPSVKHPFSVNAYNLQCS